MKKIIYSLVIIVLLGIFLPAKAQQQISSPGLNVGDLVPDMSFQMMNYTSPKTKLSDFKGKLVILDFWATWCTTCVAHFPENERLQKEFGDKIQILLVNASNTGDKKGKIESFLAKQRTIHGKNLSLPIVVSDTMANNYFPHKFIPHYAWINGEGKVIAISAPGDVNEKNIRAVLEGKEVHIFTKDDDKIKNDFSTPFLVKDVGLINNLQTFSIFTGELNMDMQVQINKMDADARLCMGTRMLNIPLILYFPTAYPEMNPIPFNRRIVTVTDSLLYTDLTDFQKSRLFCYEFITKKGQPLDVVLHKYLRDDLSRTFHCYGYVENRTVSCYVISGINSKITAGKKKNADDTNSELMLSDFVNRVNSNWKTPVVSDVTLSDHDINKIKVPEKADDFAELKKNLNAAGYDVKVETRSLPYFIIADNK